MTRFLVNAIPARLMPFADVASAEMPLSRIIRLSLFQVTVGMAMVLLTGTLNRVMIVELGMAASLVAVMVAAPVLFAPLRMLIGHRSDHNRSYIGWRRTPYIWFGTLSQFGGFAILPFALLILAEGVQPPWVGQSAAALAFLLIGAGLHTVQTAGLALASDLATDETRPRIVALFYIMLLVGMLLAALVFGWALKEFSPIRLIEVIQGAAVVTIVINIIAMWQQEPRDPERTKPSRPRPAFRTTLAALIANKQASRFMAAVAVGTCAFSMQDVLLEPYGGELLSLSVSATTLLTAVLATGTLIGIWFAARRLSAGRGTMRSAAIGLIVGMAGFVAIICADPLQWTVLFCAGVGAVGFGGGLFAVGTLTAAMQETDSSAAGLVLGAWGAVQAVAAGVGVALGGMMRDGVGALAEGGYLGPVLTSQTIGYSAVYHFEIVLLLVTLALCAPLSRAAPNARMRLGLTHFPG